VVDDVQEFVGVSVKIIELVDRLGVDHRGSAKSVSRGEDEVDGPARVSSLMS